MQVSPTTIYAIQALRALDAEPLTNDELARRLDISFAYAIKVNTVLRKAGVIVSTNKGYKLTCPLGKVQMDQVVRVAEGLASKSPKDTEEMAEIRAQFRKVLAAGLRRFEL